MLEVRTDGERGTSLVNPDVTDVTVSGAGRLLFRTESGREMSAHEYRAERACNHAYYGFAFVFVLENEDTLKETKLVKSRLKHRVAVTRPTTDDDFALCLLLYVTECLPVSRVTLLAVLNYLQTTARGTSSFFGLVRRSCMVMTCSCLYLFFDVSSDVILTHVPKTYILHQQVRRSRLDAASAAISGLLGSVVAPGDAFFSLSFATRQTRDGYGVRHVMHEVVSETVATVGPSLVK